MTGAFDMFGAAAYPSLGGEGESIYGNPNGALSGMPTGVLDPRVMALFGLSQGLLKAGAPTSTPTGFGPALGSGIQGGMQGLVQGHQLQQQEAYRQAQIKQMADTAARQERALNQPKVVPPGGALVADGQPVYQAPFKPDAPQESPMAKLLRERNALPEGHPDRAAYDDAIKRQSTHQPPVEIKMPAQERKFDEEVGKALGEQYAGIMKYDMNAPVKIEKYRRLGNLLTQAGTGKFTGTTVQLKAMAKAAGVDLSALGIGDNVAPAEAARALVNQLALEMRSTAEGAGMPGSLSERDLTFLLDSIPSLESDPSAWPKMIEYQVKLAQRQQQVAKMARAYRKKTGKFDEGFYDELQEWSNKNHMFPQTGTSTPPISDDARRALDKYAPQQ